MVFVFADRGELASRCLLRSRTEMVERVGSRRPRSQCGERHPRRLPGLDTLGEITVLAVASIGAAALARVGRRVAEERGRVPPGFEQPRPDATARVRRRLGAGHVPRRRDGVAVVALRGTQPARRRFRRRAARRLGDRAPLHRRTASTRFGHCSRFRPWTVLGTGLLLAGGDSSRPALHAAVPCSTSRQVGDTARSSARSISAPPCVFDIGVYLTVVGMVLMAFEAFGEDAAEATQ